MLSSGEVGALGVPDTGVSSVKQEPADEKVGGVMPTLTFDTGNAGDDKQGINAYGGSFQVASTMPILGKLSLGFRTTFTLIQASYKWQTTSGVGWPCEYDACTDLQGRPLPRYIQIEKNYSEMRVRAFGGVEIDYQIPTSIGSLILQLSPGLRYASIGTSVMPALEGGVASNIANSGFLAILGAKTDIASGSDRLMLGSIGFGYQF